MVSICCPDQLHCSEAAEFLMSQSPPRVLLIEKPICTEPEELVHLMELGERSGATVAVNHTRRFDPVYRRVAQLVQAETLGRFVGGRWVYYGGWVHNGTHAVDTLRMFFAETPRLDSSTVVGSGRPGDVNVDVTMLVRGAQVYLEAFDEAHYQLFDAELRFQSGRIRLDDFGANITIQIAKPNEQGERVLQQAYQSPLAALDSPLYHAVDAIDAHLSGPGSLYELGVDLATASETMRIVWEASR